ncbi:hypothetical protein FLCH110379_12085 [Flavobacterium chungbukense]
MLWFSKSNEGYFDLKKIQMNGKYIRLKEYNLLLMKYLSLFQ